MGVSAMRALAFVLCMLVSAAVSAVGLPPGFGGSTYTCIDVDADGYGTGPGCLGPDADDNDATVHSSSQMLTKWGTLQAFLAHLGYNPLRIWYLATTGNDATGAVNDVTKPFANYSAIRTRVIAGDAVIMRNGWNGNISGLPAGGAPGAPILFMSYPGELAVIDGTAAADGFRGNFDITERSYIIVDGLKTITWGAIRGGTGDAQSSSLFHDNVIRHTEAQGNDNQGLGGFSAFNGLVNLTLEFNVWHPENVPSDNQHCLYIGARGIPNSNITVRNNICFDAPWNGFHLNGRFTNSRFTSNVIYNVGIAGISMQEGTSNSQIDHNLIFASASSGIELTDYAGDCAQFGQGGSGAICPYDQTGNTFDHNTIYPTDHRWYSGETVSTYGFVICNNDVGTVGDLGHNTYTNNIVVAMEGTHYPSVVNLGNDSTACHDSNYVATDTFTNNNFFPKTSGTAHFGTGSGVVGLNHFTPPSSYGGFGSTSYDCTQAATIVASMTGCQTSNPLFVNTNATWQTPTQFDFALQSGSPAAGLGAIGTATGDTTPPVVSFVTPANGASITCLCQVQTSASDNSGTAGITQTLVIDGKVRATATGATLNHTRRLSIGPHTLSVTAKDAAGNSSTASISVTVH